MNRVAGAFAAVLAVALSLAAIAVLVAFRVPTGEYRGVQSEPMWFDGEEVSSVYAVAVTTPDVSYGTLWIMQHDVVRSPGKSLPTHISDPSARASRLEAWGAAHVAVGESIERWVVSDQSATAVGQVLDDVDCNAGSCSATVVGGEATGFGEVSGTRVAFVEPPPGVLTPDVSKFGTPPVSKTLEGWTGGSAGLAYALAYVEHLTGRSVVPPGLRVAATGHVSVSPESGGVVQEVDGIEAKVESASLSDADVLLVPAGQGVKGGLVPTVEVKSVADALNWMCAHGSEHPQCSASGKWRL